MYGMINTMKVALENAYDFRQSPYWKKYMRSIGWFVETVDGIQLYIRHLPFIHVSFIKIQHPLPPYSLKKIDTIAKKYYALSVIFEPHIYGYDPSLFRKHGYEISTMHHAPTATRKIAIHKPVEQILATFSENAKRNIKKAQKNNLTIKTVFGKDDKNNTSFELFYTLQKNLTDMKKFYAPGYEESKKKYHALKQGSCFVFAFYKKEPVAAVWYGYYKGVITYLQTGITQKGYDLLANYLLVVAGIKIGKKVGCTVLDFESIYDTRYPSHAKRWKGYSEFKSRFHGEAVYYPPSWIKIYHPVYKWFYKISRRFIP